MQVWHGGNIKNWYKLYTSIHYNLSRRQMQDGEAGNSANQGSQNYILHDESEATISREVISTTQTPFCVERFWNDQMDNREAMACVTVVNGMQYGITMQPFGGTELAPAQVQAFRLPKAKPRFFQI